ncbi:hypothetical protein DH2020_018834 [Rehmannia glutinosa]|uniref:DDE Tnp4 domain-containing protein n=1 Tax=Rehmannia glutinosa TaxID=99300 RepID=A0ABR0WKD3_REHGL
MEPWDIRDYDSVWSSDITNCALIHPIFFLMRKLKRMIIPCRTSMRTGHVFIEEILNGHGKRCYQAFRLAKPVFLDLFHELTHKYDLHPTRGMSIFEEVGIFLMTCAHGVDNRLMQEILNHSGETISRHFHSVLKAISKLANDIIRPHPEYNEGKRYHTPQHQRYIPFFKDCIGAIDGTHVKARLPQGKAIPYIGRKGYPTQNILAVVDFNMFFTFVWAGWEGAAHDCRIFGEAIRSPDLNFPIPKGKKYYLVDAGYSHMPGYMGPYKGQNIRYHLVDFPRARTRQLRGPRNLKEKFNYYHSSCRNCIERTFGVWKARWNILADMPYFHIDKQREIVLATMAIHNNIKTKNIPDKAFQIAEDENYEPYTKRVVETSTRNFNVEEENNQCNAYWMVVRDSIAMDIAGSG